MTPENFKALKSHDKIKFIGDPNMYYPAPQPPKTSCSGKKLLPNKSYIVAVLYNDINATVLSLYGNDITIPKDQLRERAADWEFIEARHDAVEQSRKSKLGVVYAQNTLVKFRNDINAAIKQFKVTFDYYLNNINISEKLMFLSHLKTLDKATAEMLFEYKDIEDLIAKLQRNDNDETKKG